MIRRLRKRLIITIMSFITAILILLLGMITFIPINTMKSAAFKTLNNAVSTYATTLRHEGKNKKLSYHDLGLEKISDSVIFIEVNRHDIVRNWTANRMDLYTKKDILRLKESIDEDGEHFGVSDGYFYLKRRMFRRRTIYGVIDTNSFYDEIMNSLMVLILFGVVSWVIFLMITVKMVENMLAPVKESFQKQKQFIADAGHELKTPVAVITANANVLEREIGRTKWLDYITMEAQRMQTLIKDLMVLAELDDADKLKEYEQFDLSNELMGATLPYESLAFEKGTTLSCNIEDNVQFYGNKQEICRMISALVSNAVTYCNENGRIEVSLKQKKKEIVLYVYNTGDGIQESERERIFERFYRVDPSRTRNGENYGLGLSIVRSIVNEYHGRIKVSGTPGEDVCFTIFLYSIFF